MPLEAQSTTGLDSGIVKSPTPSAGEEEERADTVAMSALQRSSSSADKAAGAVDISDEVRYAAPAGKGDGEVRACHDHYLRATMTEPPHGLDLTPER